MTSRRFQILLEWDAEEGVWVTYVPALGYISTFGETREQALEQTREAIVGYIEAAEKEGLPLLCGEGEAELVEIEVALS